MGESVPAHDRASPTTDRGPFELCLLGGFSLRDAAGQPVELPTRKCELLLAYLAMPAGRLHGRDKLAALFWSDRDEEQARGSLRKALSSLRAALGPQALGGDRDAVTLDPAALAVDADRLASLASNPAGIDEGAAPVWRYGEFLESRPSASAEFSDWLTFERTRCRNLAQTVLEGMALRLADAGDLSQAQSVGQRLLAIDNLREESHRLLMRLYARAGERSRALAQFRGCRELLKRELGVEPSQETVRLSRQIASDAASAGDAAIRPPDGPVSPMGQEAAPAPSWPTERPRGLSIAVLPFAGKNDGEQDFLANGISQDIITELSRQRDFLVIAPQSTVGYGGGAGEAGIAARDLDVRYILAGSVRRGGDQLRVAVQLIDASGDRCVWAERYDRPAQDVFDLQDEVVRRIIANIDAEVRAAERESAARKRPENLDAWELFHRGMWHAYRFTRDDHQLAQGHFERALELEPGFSLPYAVLAYVCLSAVTWHFTADVGQTLGAGIAQAEKALALDAGDAFSHVVLGRLLTFVGDRPRAAHHLSMAIDLSPSFAQAYFGMAQLHFWSGRPREALHHIGQAVRLNPRDPLGSMFMTLQSFCHYWLDDFAAAEAAARRATALNARETWSRLGLAAALVALDRAEEARTVIAEARRMDQGLTVASFDAVVGQVPDDLRQRVYSALRQAGLG
ncbi:MAG: adenylate cyclase [Mesorhizobium sp.]|uniref:BTAD domain-containing putative transcriptional regulator n=1 Tax=Mesorhizobium sp. TaxID=1871066 RepID=UPI000FE47A95|nr:BTAD domain-containing putative transcriptional regulator [Mesorhizobium sp.]RWF41205.1 MAG: adenylate cyclase [Mesorhizobium sp.]